MSFIRTALALALVATLAVPAAASPTGDTWFPTLTWPTKTSPADADAGK